MRTDKGEEELATRRHGLDQRHRMALILVDGKADVSGLRAKAAGLPELDRLLEELAVEGFIAADNAAWRPAAGTDPGDRLKAELVDLAILVLGGQADPVIKKLQAAPPDRPGLEAALDKACKLVRLTLDEAKADELAAKGRELLAGG